MKAFFQVNSAGRAYAWMLAFAGTRAVLDYFWVPIYSRFEYKVLSLFNTTVYMFTLYLVIPAVAGFVLGKVFARRVDDAAMLRESVLVWIVYPLVTVISLLMKSPPVRSVPWFRYIPTFMVETNFLPAGMIVVIPILIAFYTRLLMRHSGADWLRALASVLVSLLTIYLAYYQYTLKLFIYVYKTYGLVFGFGYATLTYLIPLFPLAGRFHAVFGRHPVMLPRVVLVATLISLGLMVPGFAQSITPPAQAQVLPMANIQALPEKTQLPASPTPSTVRWNLRFFQLYDGTGGMAAYGFFLDSKVGGLPLRRFRLSYADRVFENPADVTSDAGRLSYPDVLDIRIAESKLSFDWNQAEADGDPFLESFAGTDVITDCTATLDGVSHRCFLLDENLSADASQIRSWTAETFLAIAGDDVSLIALAYDDYTDGVIALGNDRRRITGVSREDWGIRISFENGSANADCSPLASYETLSGLDPQPVDSPVRCELTVRTYAAAPATTRADGLLEWIGQTQGE